MKKLTGKPICNGLCYHSQYVKFPSNGLVGFFWHWFKNRRSSPVASRLSAEMHTVILACAWRITCEDRIPVEPSLTYIVVYTSTTQYTRTMLLKTVNSALRAFLPGFLNMRQPFIILSHSKRSSDLLPFMFLIS